MTFDVLQVLGLQSIKGAVMSDPIPVRFDQPTLKRLDRAEALLRARGYREANRSSLVRAAVGQWLDGLEEAGIELTERTQDTSRSEESLTY